MYFLKAMSFSKSHPNTAREVYNSGIEGKQSLISLIIDQNVMSLKGNPLIAKTERNLTLYTPRQI